jgi:hypothetical protein
MLPDGYKQCCCCSQDAEGRTEWQSSLISCSWECIMVVTMMIWTTKDERSNNAISSGVSARLIALHPLQYWISEENYFQLLHTKMCVKGVGALDTALLTHWR